MEWVENKLCECNQMNCSRYFEASDAYNSNLDVSAEKIPNLINRRHFPSENEYSDSGVDKEIQEYGSYLAKGQILFHGGQLSLLDGRSTDKPLSTSLCLAQTKNHASKSSSELNDLLVSSEPRYTDAPPEIWVLRVAEDYEILGYFYSKDGAANYKSVSSTSPPEEFEVLISSGFIVECVLPSKNIGKFVVTIADIRLS